MSRHKFAVGDRVRYVAHTRDDWTNKTATISLAYIQFGERRYDVEFDEPYLGTCTVGRQIPETSLEYINVIDPKRPIQTTETPPRECRTIGVLERTEGVVTLLLSVPFVDIFDRTAVSKKEPAEIEIDLNGKAIGELGTGLTFRNEPKVESSFYPMDKLGPLAHSRGRTSLSGLFLDYSLATHALEIVTIDGEPTEAKIHARN